MEGDSMYDLKRGDSQLESKRYRNVRSLGGC